VKKCAIVGAALGLAIICLVRFDLVAQEAADKPQAVDPPQKALVINFVAELGDKLTEAQRAFCEWDMDTFGLLNPARWQHLGPAERAAKEEEFLKQLSSDEESQRVKAIDNLVALNSSKAVPGILQIAADRKEKNNWDRTTATRALGMLGDRSVVPELVQLTYHYNWNVRQWAQIGLVRHTGQNFGRDLAAWRRWWAEQGGKPPISEETIQWATTPEMLKHADPQVQEKTDREWFARYEESKSMQSPRDVRSDNAANYWVKYRRWAGYHKGTGGVQKNPEEANRLLAELVRGAYVVTFKPIKGFAPKTPYEFLAKFLDKPILKSGSNGLGGASFFRTKAQDGVLIGSFLTESPDETRETLEAAASVEVISVEQLTPEMFIRHEAFEQESLANNWGFTESYERWAAYHKGYGRVDKNPEEAKKLLAGLIEGGYLVTFRPTEGFAPKTPQEFLARFWDDPVLKSDGSGFGGASFFRTKVQDGVLIGSFLTAHPEETREAIQNTPSVEVISVEKLTPEIFIRHEASPQESLPMAAK
jgi:hypothetical protein